MTILTVDTPDGLRIRIDGGSWALEVVERPDGARLHIGATDGAHLVSKEQEPFELDQTEDLLKLEGTTQGLFVDLVDTVQEAPAGRIADAMLRHAASARARTTESILTLSTETR